MADSMELNRERAKRAQQMPDGVQYAIVTALPNSHNGAFWGFTSYEDVKDHAEVIKSDPNIIARRLGNACLIEVNPDYLVKCCNIIDPRTYTPQDIAELQHTISDATASFEKYLLSKAAKGETQKPTKIGIYCVNDVTAIRYDGVMYPAFRVNMATAVSLLAKWGYGIATTRGMIDAGQLGNSFKEIFAASILSPTKTGIFIDIQCRYSPAQVQQMKAQLGIK